MAILLIIQSVLSTDKNMDKEILDSMNNMVRLLTILVKREANSQNQIIKEMSDVGFPPKKISELLNTSSNTVNVAIHLSKKNNKK